MTPEVTGEQRSVTTNDVGDFIVPGLVPEACTIRVGARGFRALERKNNVVLAAGQLEVGTLAESITFTAQGQEVATTTTSHTVVMENKQVALISPRGRDPMSLLRILPGVQQAVDTDRFGGESSGAGPAAAWRRFSCL